MRTLRLFWLGALLLASACATVRCPAAETFLASDTTLTTATTTTVASQAFTVLSTAETYFVLGNVVVFNQSNNLVLLTLTVDEASSGFTASTRTFPITGGATYTLQIPVTVSALTAGAYTARLRATADSANVFVLQTTTYIGVYSSTVPGTVIVQLNGQTATVQSFAVGTSGTNFAVSSSGGVHTFNLPDASASNRGAVTTGAQTIGGLKTFANGVVARAVGVASTTLIGAGAAPVAAGDMAIGDAAISTGNGSTFPAMAIGNGAAAIGNNAQAIGAGSGATGNHAIAVGAGASAGAADTIAIGINSSSGAVGAISIGKGPAGASATRGVAIGYLSAVTAQKAIALGPEASSTVAFGIAVGDNAAASAACVAIGAGGSCTSSGQFALGGTDTPITQLIIGKGSIASSPDDIIIRPSIPSGTNVDGGDLTLESPGTGSAFGGTINLKKCPRGGSGTSVNTCSAAWSLDAETGALYPTSADLGVSSARVSTAYLANFDQSGTFKLGCSNTQAITAAATAVTVTKGCSNISSDANYTLSAAPTIADGATDQVVIIQDVDSGSDCITLQDQGTLASSNLRLGATTRLLCSRDSIALRWNGSDWTELWFTNVL